MDRWVGKVAVVTGASSGIGLATAKLLLDNGLIVVGLDKNLEAMEEQLENFQNFRGRKCDISIEEEVDATFSWIRNTLGGVHVLINNAGIVKIGSLLDVSSGSMKEVIDVNLMGTLYCTRAAGKWMKESGEEAIIIFISSILSHSVPSRFCEKINVYPSTKFAVRAISEICKKEFLRSGNVRISNISPGRVNTRVFEAAGVRKCCAKNKPFLQPEDIAESILHVISAPSRVNITELTIVPLGEEL